jgi:hypothetical protein
MFCSFHLSQGGTYAQTALSHASENGHVAAVEAIVAADPDRAHIQMTSVRLKIRVDVVHVRDEVCSVVMVYNQ